MHLEFPDLDMYNANSEVHGSSRHNQHALDAPFRSKQQQILPASASPAFEPYGARPSCEVVAASTRRPSAQAASQPPTRQALEQFSAPHRNFATTTTQGFRGLLDKSKEVPSLMDNNDSDSMSSSKATTVVSAAPSNSAGRSYRNTMEHVEEDMESVSDIFDGISVSKESDVFDNVSFGDMRGAQRRGPAARPLVSFPERIVEEDDNVIPSFGATPADDGEFKLVLLGGGLSAIQTTNSDFLNRSTAKEFDGNLSVSDVSSNGYAKIPGFNEMVSAGMAHDNSLRGIQGNLGMQPRSHSTTVSAQDNERDETCESGSDSCSTEGESSHRSSLFSDPYRGDGGLDLYGDLSEYYVHPALMKKVLRKYRTLSESSAAKMNFTDYENEEDERKAFALFEMRSRVMEKDIERGLERRGGSFMVDDIVTTSYNRTAHRIRDAVIVSKAWRDGATISDVVNSAVLTRRMAHSHFIPRPNLRTSASSSRYTWEAVCWLDDTDMLQYRCPSLGSRHMRGFEMFTIGDCQSILLKLTNERCMELRRELNTATRKQIVAEDLLKEEGDNVDGMMSETEMTYLMAMEAVKTISKKLVSAEAAFTLVRDRIKKLISRYEALLLKIENENESIAGASSVVTQSSFYSDYETSEYRNEEERIWARRAVRAEVRAEIAVREALMAKQTARKLRDTKTREIEVLKKRLEELQSECSEASAEKERAVAAKVVLNGSSAQSSSQPVARISKEKLDGVKKRFRDRMQAKKQPVTVSNGRAPLYPTAPRRIAPSPQAQAERELIRSAGEEMYQQMVFYERSLEAVGSTNQ